MDNRIKQLVDSGNLKELKYIFVDSLDVDPTFVKFEDDYNYCKKIMEPYQELTPLTDDQSKWTSDYWAQLKTDLIKNFSDRRFSHMRKVAQVLKAEKIQRLNAERTKAEQQRWKLEEAKRKLAEESAAVEAEDAKRRKEAEERQRVQERGLHAPSDKPLSKAEQQQRELEEARRKLAEENAAEEAERHKKEADREKTAQGSWESSRRQTTGTQRPVYPPKPEEHPKNGSGIALVLLAAAIVVVLLILMWLLIQG